METSLEIREEVVQDKIIAEASSTTIRKSSRVSKKKIRGKSHRELEYVW